MISERPFRPFLYFLLFTVLGAGLFSCSTKKEVITSDAVSDYVTLATGKYITYRVDSTVFPNFGRNTEIHSYQIKHVVDAQITDNMGRPAYRIYTYLRDSAGLQAWRPTGTYVITALADNLEVTEDNLRFMKLHLPLIKAFTWKGNKYLPTNPYNTLFSFSNDDNMVNWDYAISGVGESFSFNGKNYTNVLTIDQADDKLLVDTFNVVNNAVTVPANKSAAWIAGNGTAAITVNAAPSNSNIEMRVYNSTNNTISLNNITVPAGYSRNYRYSNNAWGMGDNGKDTLYTDLPYGYRTYSTEKYSKGTGLVFKHYEMWEFQPNIGGATPFKTGFGVKMWMIDHN